MARKPKASAEIDNRPRLIDALRFVGFASSGHDNESFKYVKIKNGLLTAADNVIAIGNYIESEMDICLHGDKLKAALEECGQDFQFTEVDKSSVSIRSQKFRALVPTMDGDLLQDFLPDEPLGFIDDRLKTAFEIANIIVEGKGTGVLENGAFLRANSLVATNGKIAFDCWHGIDLPNGLIIPKRALTAIAKSNKKLAAFGFSNTSATFHFEDNSFIKTKLEEGSYPIEQVDRLYHEFNGAPFTPIFTDFFKGMDAIKSFVSNDCVYFHANYIASSKSLDIGANYHVEGLRGGYAFGYKFWQMVKPFVNQICFHPDPSKPTAFLGSNVRGLIMGRRG